MDRSGQRLIISFYGENKVDAKRAFESFRKQLRGNAWFVNGVQRGDKLPDSLERYRRTLVQGECLMAGFVDLSRDKGALDTLRLNESNPVFILNEEADTPEKSPAPAMEASPVSIEETFRALADTHSDLGQVHKRYFTSLIEKAETRLAGAYAALSNSTLLGHAVTTTGEWLLDNNYLFEVDAAEVKASLPKRYGPSIPGLSAHQNLPRIYVIARTLAHHLSFAADSELVTRALQAYQTRVTLNVAELWLFPAALRLAILEGASQIAARAAHVQGTREFAYFWTNRLLTASRVSPAALDEMLQTLGKEPLVRSEPFISVLAEQLHEEDMAQARFQTEIGQLLKDSLSDVIRREHQAETADRTRVANAVGTLRKLAQIDFTKVFVKVSRVEEILNSDPSLNYPKSDFATRNQSRDAVEDLARRCGKTETEVARAAIRLAKEGHTETGAFVEYYLIGLGLPALETAVKASVKTSTRLIRWIHRHPTFTYLFLVLSLTGLLTAIFVIAVLHPQTRADWLDYVLCAAAIFPLSEFAIQIVNALVVSTLPPTRLPRLNFEEGIPEGCQTMVAVPMMLSSRGVLAKELEKLETRYLGNRNPQLCFALLADFMDAPSGKMAGDEVLLEAARDGIDELCKRHGVPRFFLLHRKREWSESEQAWIGRERKRGKIEDLNALLCGEPAGICSYPALDRSISFVISLDADTQLPAGSARKLIETIAHPLNRVRLSADGRQRLSGYTIIQPRVSIGLPGASVTRFTRIFADARGTDPYCQAVSDLYQDLFSESIFHGKAIYDVAAMHAILHNRFPANTILSHDLIEGAHVGVAAASQIELFENLPTDYPAFARRQHRWIRGDWQIGPWIFGSVPIASGGKGPNPLRLMNRWQVLDNLRRSLVAPVSILMLFVAWLFSPAAGLSSFLIALTVGIPSLAPVVDRLARNASKQTRGTIGLAEEIQRTFVYFSLLAHQALLSVDAITRYIYRRFVSRRRLLEWQTADAANASKTNVSATFRECLLISASSVFLMLMLSAVHRLAPAMPFLLMWAVSPLVVIWLARPVARAYPEPVGDDDQTYLRLLARRVWRTFDDLVGPQTNWMPPDNTQLALRVEVAQRTSPTNIGLWFTSVLSASDLGFITPEELLHRSRASIASIERLERYEGHWLNWYNLETLQPLDPKYVSTVDSGNLLACFWVFEQGLRETPFTRSPGPQCLSGMAATLGCLEEVMGKDAAVALPLGNLRRLLQSELQGHEVIDSLRQAKLPIQNLKKSLTWFASEASEPAYWVRKLDVQCNAWLAHCDIYLGWMETLAGAPDQLLQSIHPDLVEARWKATQALPSVVAIAQGTHAELNTVLSYATAHEGTRQSAWLEQLDKEYRQAQAEAQKLLDAFNELAEHVERLASSIDMSFLYDNKRMLFGIGYEVGNPVAFNSHYDLLASECRLASFAAIAKGDVPVEHWQALGRPYVSTNKGQVLLSWSGTMFEYLMPILFMRPFENSLLAEAARLAIDVQREHCASFNRPWGISEAAYSALDANQIYQYRAFGVPGLGLKPGLEGDWVVSPYSTLLALQIDSKGAIENLRAMAKLNLYGPMGFYESIDYTRPAGREYAGGVVIYCYMAHHQGMGLTALTNTLLDGLMQRRFHENPKVRAVEFLLFERVPSAHSLLRHVRTDSVTPAPVKAEDSVDRNPREIGPVPSVQLLGNGQYSVVLTNAGSGYSRWRDIDIVRWRADTTLDTCGTFFYLRDPRSGSVWSPSVQPLGHQGTAPALVFSAGRARFERSFLSIEQAYEICVAPDDDVEIRRFTFTNRGLRGRVLEVTSFLELALAPHAADLAHQAFSKLFVQTEWIAKRNALIAWRRPRSPQEPEVWAGHMIVTSESLFQIEYESSREKFIGRNRTVRNPVALERALTGTTGTVIDPAFSIRCRFALEARERSTLAFLTVAASTRDELLSLLERYSE